MKWSMDTHKYMSETTRKALQVLVECKITGDSDPSDIEIAERKLAEAGVYRDFDGAKGRIRRALLTYFKAYDCMNSNAELTEVGTAFAENKLSVQEISFYYVVNYLYKTDGVQYYPLQLILKCLMTLYEKNQDNAYVTAHDFSKIVECDSLEQINDEFIANIESAHTKTTVEVNERAFGYDVWAKMLTQAGIVEFVDHNLRLTNISLAKWILESYDKEIVRDRGCLTSGILKFLPRISTGKGKGSSIDFADEGQALKAFLFDDVSEKIINKYISVAPSRPLIKMLEALGLIKGQSGYYLAFSGLEHLIGRALYKFGTDLQKSIGEILLNIEVTDLDINEELKNVFDYRITKGNGVNKIFYGTPGCGKSFHIEHNILGKSKESKQYDGDYKKENIIRTTFYQDYSNTDFVGQILPKVVKGENGEKDTVEYIFNPGPFTLTLIRAISNPDKKVALVVEEINRGNAPAIFGDVFQLLDRDSDGISEYGIKNVGVLDYLNDYTFEVDGEKKKYIFDEIKIPGNMYIYATMNTSDQNVYTLDTAFVRRWDKEKIKNSFNGCSFAATKVPGIEYTWQEFVDSINKHIAKHLEDLQVNEDKQIGAFFVKESLLKANDPEKFAYKVFDYLWSDVAKLDHGIFFNHFDTLEALIEAYAKTGVSVFKTGIFGKKETPQIVEDDENNE